MSVSKNHPAVERLAGFLIGGIGAFAEARRTGRELTPAEGSAAGVRYVNQIIDNHPEKWAEVLERSRGFCEQLEATGKVIFL